LAERGINSGMDVGGASADGAAHQDEDSRDDQDGQDEDLEMASRIAHQSMEIRLVALGFVLLVFAAPGFVFSVGFVFFGFVFFGFVLLA
jgi:hypothetical protein